MVEALRELPSHGLEPESFEYLTIESGRDKSGAAEGYRSLELRRGQTVALVGPTGAGKTRLLEDIEWMARGDTPSGRRVFVNGVQSDGDETFELGHRLVAQLSQTMGFMADLTAGEFLQRHAQCRGVADTPELVTRVIAAANDLTGEGFELDVPLARLSGGQSRSLMIADTALISKSPIVLIDELENAGIDRRRALELLVSSDKLVLLATHDPFLALLAEQRFVIAGGAIRSVLQRTAAELELLGEIEQMDRRMMELRARMRAGAALAF